MNKPKDYQETQKPQEVRDYVAENGIKWNGIAQGLILASIIGAFALISNFGGKFIDDVQQGIKEINGTLTEIRDLVATVNTKTEVNTSRIDNLVKDVSRNTQAIDQLGSNDEN